MLLLACIQGPCVSCTANKGRTQLLAQDASVNKPYVLYATAGMPADCCCALLCADQEHGLGHVLEKGCPAYFKAEDKMYYAANDMLRKAEQAPPGPERQSTARTAIEMLSKVRTVATCCSVQSPMRADYSVMRTQPHTVTVITGMLVFPRM